MDPAAAITASVARKGVAKLAVAVAALAQAVRKIEQELQATDHRVSVAAELGEVEQALAEALDVLEWERGGRR